MKLSEIASLLEVSPSSVSIVRNGRIGVSPLIRRKIQSALEANGYDYREYTQQRKVVTNTDDLSDSHQYLQLLKFRRSSLLLDKNEGFVDAIIDAIDESARRQKWNVLLKSVSHNDYPSFLEHFDNSTCFGMLVVATEMERHDICELSKLNIPIVILDSDHPDIPFSSVTMNNRDLAYNAVSFLFATGSKQVGYVSSSIRTGNFIGRANGYREALSAHGSMWDESMVFTLAPSLKQACSDMHKHIRDGRPIPDALFADNDIMAIGAMKALGEAGYVIPRDVRIIGVDNTPLSSISTPSLSTMKISKTMLGQQAVAALMQLVAVEVHEPIHTRLGSSLIVRDSV